MYGLVAPATLIFYGLGLVSSSKFSYNELEFLGYFELLLGFIASLYIGSGLLSMRSLGAAIKSIKT